MTTENAIREILKNIGEDPDREGLTETPERIQEMHQELFSGYNINPHKVLKTFDAEGTRDMILVRDIQYYSMCEHHMIPFFGKAHIAYLPEKKITGLSKLPRIVDIFAKRLQNQERITQQVGQTLFEELKPKGVAVMITGTHLCMHARGVRNTTSEAVTHCWLGEFEKSSDLRREFLMKIKD
ncbi:MAG: GTP cyclohydrolase I FolE [Candidatus Gracilibacteria bacterium]|nr:GTP cyclohydrolase I FolE [Candidatus Gracilibacteria bacterium]